MNRKEAKRGLQNLKQWKTQLVRSGGFRGARICLEKCGRIILKILLRFKIIFSSLESTMRLITSRSYEYPLLPFSVTD
jgi:hypothetical protein